MIGKERVEVGIRDDLDRAAGVVKVGDHRGSVDNLIVGQVDIPAMSPALAGEMRRMTGTGCVGSSPRVECDVVDFPGIEEEHEYKWSSDIAQINHRLELFIQQQQLKDDKINKLEF